MASKGHLVIPPTQSQLQQIAQRSFQMFFSNSSTSLGNLFQQQIALTVKKALCNFYFDLCLLLFILSLHTTKTTLLLSFTPSNPAFIHTHEVHPEHVFSRLNGSISLSFSLHVRCSSPLIIPVGSLLYSLHYIPAPIGLGSPELNTALQVWSHQCSTENPS